MEVDLHETGQVRLRDSKTAAAPFSFTPEEWDAFVLGVKAGEFDRDRPALD